MDEQVIKFMEFHGYFWSNDLQRFVTRAEAIAINLSYMVKNYGCSLEEFANYWRLK